MNGSLVGVAPLARVTGRQDVRNIAPWIVLITALSASSILAYAWVFPDAHDRQVLAGTLGANPALSLVFGPARDLSTADGFNAWRAGQLGALFAALMAVLVVVRNSRANEDSGQAELIASGVIARGSRLGVAVLLAGIASIVLGLVCFLVTLACGGGAVDTLVLSATFTAAGLMFAAVAAVAAQIGADARTSSSIAIGALGVFYVLRGYIDMSSAPRWVRWLTPLGWLEQTKPAAGNNPWPLLLTLAFAVVLTGAAFVLQARRDFGQGLLSPRAGKPEGGMTATVWGLPLRLHAGSVITWLIACTGLGLVFGTLASSVGDLIANNPATAALFTSGAVGTRDITYAFVATILQMIAIIVAIMGVQIVMRVHTEEIADRVEPLLATPLRRHTYLASNTVFALVGTAAALLLAGIALGLVASAQEGSVSTVRVIAQALATVPAVWTLVLLALAAVGAKPLLRLIGWLGVVATFALTLLGPTFNLADWMLDISPLRHVPNVAASAPDWTGLGWLALFAVLFLAIAFGGYRRRDIL